MSFRGSMKGALAVTVLVLFAARATRSAAQEQASLPGADGGRPFPAPSAVFEGRAFKTPFEKNVFFLRRIRERYPEHWPSLLAANILVKDYVQSPDKLLRFVEELGEATAGTDDVVASTNLVEITSNPDFYANTNAYWPKILRAAAGALIQIGPKGREGLADAFSQDHYRRDPVSLEVLAEAVGQSGMADPKLVEALAGTAFTLTATNGGSYPKCTEVAAASLLRLRDGVSAIEAHLNPKEVFGDPGRFQAVVNAVAAARVVSLLPRLVELASQATTKLEALSQSPGPYRSELLHLHRCFERAVGQLRQDSANPSQ